MKGSVYSFIVVVSLLSSLAFTSCSSTRVVLPIKQAPEWYHVPIQQKVVADAVESAVSELNVKPFVGKKVYVEALGVFPHTDRELLDYCVDSVRSRFAEEGANIIFAKLIQATQPSTIPVMAPPDPNEVDYYAFVAVASGGADQERYRSFLWFSGTNSLIGRARLRVSAYPTQGGKAEISTVSGECAALYKRLVFWFISLSVPPPVGTAG